MPILRKTSDTLFNLGNAHVTLSNLGKCPVTSDFLMPYVTKPYIPLRATSVRNAQMCVSEFINRPIMKDISACIFQPILG